MTPAELLAFLAAYYERQDEVTGDACPLCGFAGGHGADCELRRFLNADAPPEARAVEAPVG